MPHGRRRFVTHGSVAAASLGVSFTSLWSRRVGAREYGELVEDPNGILDLPEGFSYAIVEQAGAPMDDGYMVPGRPDGMACFAGEDGTWVLMRNHEVSAGDASNGPYGFGEAPEEAYDPAGFGGVTRVVIDPQRGTHVSTNLVLTGTVRNCAGGPSPWGWLSCEESVDGDHGYVFVCPADASSVQPPRRVDGFGRYNHEAAAVDPQTLVTYLTEDRGDSCLYRFVPDDATDPFTGTLQALRVVGEDNRNTSVGLAVGDALEIDWVDIQDPTPAGDSVRFEAHAAGAAMFSRGEGIWFFDGEVFVACTNGGPAGLGQIFRLVDGPDGGVLELIAQSESYEELDFPDNITVAPWGQLFLAEDGGGDQYVRAIAEDGTVMPFARNAVSDSELAGVCFSPDGTAMFVNIQGDGLTLMVTGPFPEVPDDGTGSSGGESTGDAPGDDDDADGDSSGGAAEGIGEDSGDGGADSSGGAPDDDDDDESAGSSGGGDGTALGDGDGCGCTTDEGSTLPGVAAAAAALVAANLARAPSDD